MVINDRSELGEIPAGLLSVPVPEGSAFRRAASLYGAGRGRAVDKRRLPSNTSGDLHMASAEPIRP